MHCRLRQPSQCSCRLYTPHPSDSHTALKHQLQFKQGPGPAQCLHVQTKSTACLVQVRVVSSLTMLILWAVVADGHREVNVGGALHGVG